MKKVVRQYFCDRCGAEIAEADLQYLCEGSMQIVGKSGKHVFLVKIRQNEANGRGVHHTLVMCQSCWDELNKKFEGFMKK